MRAVVFGASGQVGRAAAVAMAMARRGWQLVLQRATSRGAIHGSCARRLPDDEAWLCTQAADWQTGFPVFGQNGHDRSDHAVEAATLG